MPTSENRQLLTRNELCAEYGFAESTERRARTQGRFIPHLRIGRKVYYRREAVEAWLVRREQDAQASQAGGHRA